MSHPPSFLRDILCRRFELSHAEATTYLNAFHRHEFDADQVFVQAGSICHHLGIIEEGLMKCTFVSHDKEVIHEFLAEGSFATSYASFLTEMPSSKRLVCLEPTVVWVANRQDLIKLVQDHPFVQRMTDRVNRQLFLLLHEQLRSVRLDSAEQRYLALLEHRPDLAQRIPQYLLASYLHVTPETLSRIRRNLQAAARS
ncbi:Crp/Fnr family transcriptional regulator [Pontibacter sp. G13]|uniref:Crp/Fnr family transcriptional regulator n=1 Tax=Pontibacter sp. G13 TaxID=3074898 RepID=UPI002889164C|nr:Crp/Fnr family transcriptional regulator [Pontibacter sp. G13]WNJ20020.1 Crp/Fnr family transcriptional regulator [Pontibacter sp. G13]